jgi:hypothetical protein
VTNCFEADAAEPDLIEQPGLTLNACFRRLLRHPREMLILRWNWKAALFSSLLRGAIFFFANLNTGLHAASGAMLAEFVYRALSAGFYAAATQAFRKAEPRRTTTLAVMIGLPIVSHAIELTIHWLRGTPNLRASLAASVVFTMFSTLFSLHAMRRGVMVVGQGSQSLGADLRALPRTLTSFITSGFGLRNVIRGGR